MSAADELAALKEPTAEQVREIFDRNGLTLTVVEGRVVPPKGITPAMAALVEQHHDALVISLNGGRKKNEKATRPTTEQP